MVDFTAETPRETYTIAGIDFSIPMPYVEGHQITAGEADALNQTLAENVRNNRAKKVNEAKDEAQKNGTEVNISALQNDIDGYIAGYEFGVRQGGFRTSDPIEAEAMRMALVVIKSAIQKKGRKIKEFSADQLTALCKAYLDKNPSVRDTAKETVELRAAAESALPGLDLNI